MSVCPHCGRPNRKSHLSIELAAGVVVAMACFVALAWQSTWQGDSARATVVAPAPPETVMARPYRQLEQSLTALISYNRRLNLLRVENRDTFSWTDCQITLNSRGMSGYELALSPIKPGLTDAVLLQSAEFAASDGSKFDPSTASVATLDLDCDSPRGRLYYGGRFGAGDSARSPAS